MSTAFFVLFLLIFQIFRIIKIVVSKGVAVDLILELLFHISMTFLPFAIPISVLFASIYTLNKMSEDSEIVAMRSFGISKFRLLLPFLIVGIVIAVATFSLARGT